jgi:hypothetical protein
MEHANIIIRLKKQPMTVRGSFRLEQRGMWNEGMRWMKGRREGKGGERKGGKNRCQSHVHRLFSVLSEMVVLECQT